MQVATHQPAEPQQACRHAEQSLIRRSVDLRTAPEARNTLIRQHAFVSVNRFSERPVSVWGLLS